MTDFCQYPQPCCLCRVGVVCVAHPKDCCPHCQGPDETTWEPVEVTPEIEAHVRRGGLRPEARS